MAPAAALAGAGPRPRPGLALTLAWLALASAAGAAAAAGPTAAGAATTAHHAMAECPMRLNELTPAEAQIILHKGTEPPFSGRFHDHFADGTYVCRQCNAPLFASSAKFRSGCGWPSFDAAFPDAVRQAPDADGQRTEILCARCGAHLGHVFAGEGFTPRNLRHCVNSVSLDFVPADPAAHRTAVFAGGCFWGVEHLLAAVPGVAATTVGYTGGQTADPTYRQVCTGRTGHAEAVRVVYDPRLVSYEELCRLFFEIHDPTQRDRQGPDIGPQYRSAVFYQDEEQRQIAARLIAALRARGLDVATALEPAATFWPAEEYHQKYYERTGERPYCHLRVPRF